MSDPHTQYISSVFFAAWFVSVMVTCVSSLSLVAASLSIHAVRIPFALTHSGLKIWVFGRGRSWRALRIAVDSLAALAVVAYAAAAAGGTAAAAAGGGTVAEAEVGTAAAANLAVAQIVATEASIGDCPHSR